MPLMVVLLALSLVDHGKILADAHTTRESMQLGMGWVQHHNRVGAEIWCSHEVLRVEMWHTFGGFLDYWALCTSDGVNWHIGQHGLE